MSRKKHKRPIEMINSEVAQWCISIIIAVALALFIHNYIFQIVRVKGDSMEPTLHTGERMVVTRLIYLFGNPKRHDIVITHYPNDTRSYVKRIIATSGETLKIKEGNVYINDVILNEPYIKEAILSDFEETIVPEGKYIVMGDNRNNSRDSRTYGVGAIDKNMLLGKVEFIIWPFTKIRTVS
jgi:signal peptidase I